MVSYVKVESVAIGATTFTEVVFVAHKIIGSGPGGDMVTMRMVANTNEPVGVIQHHKWWEVIMAFDVVTYAAFFSGGSPPIVEEGSNNAFNLVVKYRDEENNLITHTYEAGRAYVAGWGPRVENYGDAQPNEVKIVVRGTLAVT